MESLEVELEVEPVLNELAFNQQQQLVENIDRQLMDFIRSRDAFSDCRRNPRFNRYPICTRVWVTPCDKLLRVTGAAEIGFTRNVSAGGACLILPTAPASELVQVEFDNQVLSCSMILRLFWTKQVGQFTEAGGAFIARV